MIKYSEKSKLFAQKMRKNQTPAESLLWLCLQKKQVLGIQFARQKPIGRYIVDFYAKTVGLVVEVDGSQHYEEK